MTTASPVTWEVHHERRLWRARMHRLTATAWRKKLGTLGFVLVVAVVVVAVFAPVIAPYDQNQTFQRPNPQYNPRSLDASALRPTVGVILASPSSDHLLGTDNLGRDILARVVYGSRLSLTIGIIASVIATVIGTAIGVVSGYFGGWFDLALQRVVDAMIAIPGLVVLLLLVQIRQGSQSLTIAGLAFLGIWSTSRVIRSAALTVRSEMYIEAARSLGASNSRLVLRYVLPNTVGPILVVFSIAIGGNILAVAGLEFLGFGVPGPSWGSMVNEGRQFLPAKPMMMLGGGGAITLTVLGFNLLGDALRDLLDPRQRGT